MTEAIDFLCSSLILMVIIIITVLFLCIGFASKNPFKKKRLNSAYKISLYVFTFGFLISLRAFYYGYADSFESLSVGKRTICLMEAYKRGREHVCRLHIIEKSTGIRKGRYYLGNDGELIGMQNDTLCYLIDEDLVLFDAANLKEIYTIGKEAWGAVSPELNVGLDDISQNIGVYAQNSDYALKPYVKLSCKNGKTYWFEPFSKQLLNKEHTKVYIAEFSKSGYELTIDAGPGSYRNFLRTESADDKLMRIVPGEHGSRFFPRSDSTTYITPFLLCIDTLKNVFVFGHYTTTDGSDFYLEAKDHSFHTLWKQLASELANDSNNEPMITVWRYTGGILYFNNGGFIIAMQPHNPKPLWISRL